MLGVTELGLGKPIEFTLPDQEYVSCSYPFTFRDVPTESSAFGFSDRYHTTPHIFNKADIADNEWEVHIDVGEMVAKPN